MRRRGPQVGRDDIIDRIVLREQLNAVRLGDGVTFIHLLNGGPTRKSAIVCKGSRPAVAGFDAELIAHAFVNRPAVRFDTRRSFTPGNS